VLNKLPYDDIVPSRTRISYLSGFGAPEWQDLGAPYRYLHLAGTEQTYPGIEEESRRIHASGYRAAGIWTDDALDDDGLPSSDVENPHAVPSRFFVAVNPRSPADRATARKLLPPEGADFHALPGMKYVRSGMRLDALRPLEHCEHTGTLVEISALSKTPSGSPTGVHEVILRMVKEGMELGDNFFMAVVSQTLTAMQRLYGLDVFTILGDPVPLQGTGIAPGVCFIPALVVLAELISAVSRESRASKPHGARLLSIAQYLGGGMTRTTNQFLYRMSR